MLVVAAEDYTGASPAQPGVTAPKYLSYYLDAIRANGFKADVYDVDARGRTAPDHLGVLSHYDAVVWYTGDDVVTRRAGWTGGNADRLAQDMMLEFRAYMNEHGNVLYTGPFAAQQYVVGRRCRLAVLRPEGRGPVPHRRGAEPGLRRAALPRPVRLAEQRRRDGRARVLARRVRAGGRRTGRDEETAGLFDIAGVDDPFTGLPLGLRPATAPTTRR